MIQQILLCDEAELAQILFTEAELVYFLSRRENDKPHRPQKRRTEDKTTALRGDNVGETIPAEQLPFPYEEVHLVVFVCKTLRAGNQVGSKPEDLREF